MKHYFKILCSAIILPLFINCGVNTADGGGVIVNNPAIAGCIRFPEGQSAYGAMAVIGRQGYSGAIDTNFEANHEGFSISYNIKALDTAYCDVQGNFFFEDLFPGDYVLVAQSKETGMLALANVSCGYNETLNVDMTLETPAELKIKPYYYNHGDSSNFVAAQIAGTGFTVDADSSSGILKFDMVPAGELEIVLFRKNNTKEVFYNFKTASGENSTLLVDPHRSNSFWTAIEPGPRDPLGRPFILSSSPSDGAQGTMVNQDRNRSFDIEIQFSHPMDSKFTNPAINVKSSDSLTVLDSIWWQGGNVVYLKLCTIDGSGQCVRGDSLYRSGITYSVIIDTNATTSLGVRFPYPDTLTFVPKP